MRAWRDDSPSVDSMQQGRGGMGSHKHGVSGHSGPSPRAKLMAALYDNRERATRKRVKPTMYETMEEAMRAACDDMKARRT